jgi:hypothetical protein
MRKSFWEVFEAALPKDTATSAKKTVSIGFMDVPAIPWSVPVDFETGPVAVNILTKFLSAGGRIN